MYSIRNRLNLSIIIVMLMLLTAAAVFLYLRVAGQVQQVFDTGLYDKAEALISLTEMDEEGLEFDFSEDGVMLEFVEGEALQYYQVWEQGSDLVLRSPSLGVGDLPRLGTMLDEFRYADLPLPDGRAGRLIEITFMPRVEIEDDEDDAWRPDGWEYSIPEARPLTLVFARERESLDETLFVIGLTVFGVCLGVLLLAALLTRIVVGSGLAPLSRLANQVSRIDESSLALRLTHDDKQSIEIAPIENQVNHLLERLQSAFERERRFSANVAHELRTPLSELKTLSEVGRMLPPDADQVSEFLDDVGDISRQMEQIVITLLELARSEAGLLSADLQDIELASYCDEIWRQAVNANGSGRTLVKDIPEDLIIETDREKLGIILANLFVNAVSYSPRDAEVQIRAEIRNNQVVLEVKNAALDLLPEDILHMKDRFWRKQRLSAGSGHSGLGLTLVDALARILQLDIDLSLDQRQMFMVTISGLHPSLKQAR